VKENKPAFMSDQKDNEEYYFGASAGYNNINNNYSTWSKYYNVDGYLTGLDNDAIQAIMDQRIAEGISGTLNRYKKDSYYWYKKVIETNGEEL